MPYALNLAIHVRSTEDHVGLSNIVGQRCHPVRLPNDPRYDCMLYKLISYVPHPAMSDDITVAEARYQLTGFSKTFKRMAALSDQIQDCWQRFSGVVNGVTIQNVMLDNVNQSLDGEVEVYMAALDFIFQYERAAG